jgi:DNA-directed RNA polymerase sigma subunit (sigma70/sigma32)
MPQKLPDLEFIRFSSRQRIALRMRNVGRTYQEIAQELDVSTERARDIVFDAFRTIGLFAFVRDPQIIYKIPERT